MRDLFPENILDDLLDTRAELEELLCIVHTSLPGSSWFFLLSGNGIVGTAPAFFDTLFADTIRQRATAASGSFLSVCQKAEQYWYAYYFERYSAFLVGGFVDCPNDLTEYPWGGNILLNALDLARLQTEKREFQAERDQLKRQIETLKQQHHSLIEENYRQFQLNQQREKEYAVQLEKEIDRQTTELRSVNAKLKESGRLKSEFLANMSHEIRTPINAIIGFSELLKERNLPGEEGEYVDIVTRSAKSLLALVNDSLDLAKIEAGRLEVEHADFNLPELLRGVADIFRLEAQKRHIEFVSRIDPSLPEQVIGDSNRLRQVLVNLAGNAVKFTEKGLVSLSANLVENAGTNIKVVFEVQDTGIGIPVDRQAAVFDKFTQADGSTTRKFGGTGLGLSICKELVALMGGELVLKSIEGSGSLFRLVLPFTVNTAVSSAENADTSIPSEMVFEESSVAGVRVLLVEDNPVNRKLATILLAKQGCEVTVAEEGFKALSCLEQSEFDIVFMDMQMPILDGLATTRRIRQIEADPDLRRRYAALADGAQKLKIIGLTANARKEDEEACYSAGMDGFLTKPIVKEKMFSVLRDTDRGTLRNLNHSN